MVAKYGGKDAEDLFAAMPPFELIQSLLVKAVQRRTWRTAVRKIMFIDVSDARLYAPVGKDTKAYVDIPPEWEAGCVRAAPILVVWDVLSVTRMAG